jgi:hypothetical protein
MCCNFSSDHRAPWLMHGAKLAHRRQTAKSHALWAGAQEKAGCEAISAGQDLIGCPGTSTAYPAYLPWQFCPTAAPGCLRVQPLHCWHALLQRINFKQSWTCCGRHAAMPPATMRAIAACRGACMHAARAHTPKPTQQHQQCHDSTAAYGPPTASTAKRGPTCSADQHWGCLLLISRAC